jgi:hypothetical protein
MIIELGKVTEEKKKDPGTPEDGFTHLPSL